MAQGALNDVLQHLRRLCASDASRDLGDSELLERFLAHREESAFAILVQRHGPMVLGVCERVLKNAHAAEDAFQATFLVLVRKSSSIRKHGSLGSWLFGVAQRIALRVRARDAAQRNRERRSAMMPQRETLDELTWQELRTVLDEEIGSLSERYRAPIVLCYLEGKSYDQAARELGWPKSSLANRLNRARAMLRKRLTSRGIVLSTAALAAGLAGRAAQAALPALLTINTVKAATTFAAGNTVVAGSLSSPAVTLAEEFMKGMLGLKYKVVAMVLAAVIIAGGAGLAGHRVLAQKPNPPQNGDAAQVIAPNEELPPPAPKATAGAPDQTAAAPEKQVAPPKVYAELRFAAQQPSIFGDASAASKEPANDFQTYRLTQVAILKGRNVILAAVRNPKIAKLELLQQQKDPVDWVSKNLKVDFPESPEIARVYVSEGKPAEQAVLVNAIVDAYLDEIVSAESKSKLERLQKLKDTYGKYDDTLRTKRRVVRDLEEAAGAGTTLTGQLQQQLQRQHVEAYSREQTRVRIALIAARARLRILQEKKKIDPKTKEVIENLTDEVAILTAQEHDFAQESGKIFEDLRLSVKSGIDMETAKDDADQVAAVAKKLRENIESANVNLNAPSRVTILRRAGPLESQIEDGRRPVPKQFPDPRR